MLNALERLVETYANEERGTRQQLAVSESQRNDYQTRQGAVFAHDAYLKQIAGLRDQLRIALSGTETKEGESAAEIAEQIKTLRAVQAVEAAPEREARTIAAEEPVTVRIRRRAEAIPTANPGSDSVASEAPAGTTLPPRPTDPSNSGPLMPPGTADDDIGTIHHVRFDPESMDQKRAGRGR